MKRSICAFFVGLFLFSSTSQSFAGLDNERSSFSRPKTQWVPEMVTYIGEVRRKEDCEDWEFVRESDGKAFDLERSPAFSAVVDEKENTHLKVKIEAEKKPSFLFWGGELVAKNVEVLAELPVHTCLNLEKISNRSTGLPRLGGKAALL